MKYIFFKYLKSIKQIGLECGIIKNGLIEFDYYILFGYALLL